MRTLRFFAAKKFTKPPDTITTTEKIVPEIESDRNADTGFSIADTSPEVNALMFQKLMSLTGEERMKMGFSMRAAAQQLILSSRPPGLSEYEKKRQSYERMYGEPALAAIR